VAVDPVRPSIVYAGSRMGVYKSINGGSLWHLSSNGMALDNQVNAIAIDPTGRFVAAGGLDKTIRIWALGEKNGTLLQSLIAHQDAILRLAWSPDGKQLLSSSSDKTVKLFRAADLSELQSFPESDWVYGLEFAPDGKSFAIGRFDGGLSIAP